MYYLFIIVIFNILYYQAYTDLPVHCKKSQIKGNWSILETEEVNS